jgi:glucose/arabinose dehydrogenase
VRTERARGSGVKRALVGAVLALSCSKEKASPAPIDARAPPRSDGLAPAFGDTTTDAPGLRRKLTVADLPPPNASESVENPPKVVPRPPNALPRVLPRFKVDLYAEGLSGPRMARVAPNGDLFVVESSVNRVRVLRDAGAGGHVVGTFASGLHQPFGIAWKGDHVYVANTDSIVRFPYRDGDTVARGPAESFYGEISGGGRLPGGGHWTRDIVFSRDGTKLFLSVGSRSNVSDDAKESRRARIFELSADGKSERVYADGIRNAVGLAIHPDTGELWASVNERDELGDDLVPDYITSVKDGGFYGWPWFYLGPHEDPRHAGKHPELKGRVLVPDVLIQAHSASLGMTFITAATWPHRGSALAAQHGSWNRTRRTGYKVILVPIENGRALGEYVDFMTGFVTPDGEVWGRPVAVAQRQDGTLFVTDDGGNCVWRVTYE